MDSNLNYCSRPNEWALFIFSLTGSRLGVTISHQQPFWEQNVWAPTGLLLIQHWVGRPNGTSCRSQNTTCQTEIHNLWSRNGGTRKWLSQRPCWPKQNMTTASLKYDVPYHTLRRRLLEFDCSMTDAFSHRQLLSTTQERILVSEWLSYPGGIVARHSWSHLQQGLSTAYREPL